MTKVTLVLESSLHEFSMNPNRHFLFSFTSRRAWGAMAGEVLE